jgi:excinuclease UvrABC ATPase subunit
MSVTRSLVVPLAELTEVEQLIGARIVKEIRERLTFLDDVGVGYLNLDRACHALRRRAQRLGWQPRSARSSWASSTSSTSRHRPPSA